MSTWYSFRKADLEQLAQDLGVSCNSHDLKRDIITKITTDPNYDLELATAEMKIIQEDKLREQEKERLDRELEKEKLEQERADKEKEKDREEREKIRIYELEKARLERENDSASTTSIRTEKTPTVSLKNILPKFDEEHSDINLFLNLFHRQALKAGVEESQLTTQLIPLLPTKIGEIILRESGEAIDDFDHIRSILLKRYKLSPEKLRSKFVSHQKTTDALWKDLSYELTNFLEGWLDGLEIKDFNSLKNLMVTDQIKKRATPEMREHFIDSWSEFTDPNILANKLDNYDLVRRPNRRNFSNNNKFENRTFNKADNNSKFNKTSENVEKFNANTSVNWRDQSSKEKSKIFDRKESRKCFLCSSTQHLKSSCPQLKFLKPKSVSFLNSANDVDTSFEPYISEGKINDKKIKLFRDTGSNCDLLPFSLAKDAQLNGEKIWIKTPLSTEIKCLPLADVKLETKHGIVFTKAAALGKDSDLEHYLLGNETNTLLEKLKRKPHFVNALTRSHAKKLASQDCKAEKNFSPEPTSDVYAQAEQNEILSPQLETRSKQSANDAEGEILTSIDGEALGPVDDNAEAGDLPIADITDITRLAGIDKTQFVKEQINDITLKETWEKSKIVNNKFNVVNNTLVRVSKDHRGNEKTQLVIPSKYRNSVLAMCHETIAAHLGATKSKDKLLRYFFWPNAIKDMERYVKTCDPCQRIGKDEKKVKAPLKLVPIISEIFSRLSIDITGPLPISEHGNKYLLTAMCLSSKYPEAIPIPDMTSETVINGLIQIFSRLGYPKYMQSDLGRNFVSILTSTFCDKFGIKLNHSSVMHPESNPIERWHRSVKRLLKVLCIESKESWERNLPHALLALRTVTHVSTGFSPAELVHGKNLRTPETILYENWLGEENKETAVTEYIFNLMNRLKKCQELATEQMIIARDKRKLWFDKNAILRKFNIGDKVLVITAKKPNKLSVNWIGPGTIVRQISETNYIVDLPERRNKEQIFHVNLLKPYHERTSMVNILISEIWDPKIPENDLDIEYPNAEPDIIDFNQIIRDNQLEEHCSAEQIEKLQNVIYEFKEIFSNIPGVTDWVTHDIVLTDDKPIRCRPYKTSPRQEKLLQQEIDRMLKMGIIVEGDSDYTSPLILVEAPGKAPRPCVDYRKLNAITKTEYFPLPNIEERVEQVASANFITIIDLTKGYWQLKLTPNAQRLAAFVTKTGTYLPVRLPFGLLNASFVFSKFVSKLLKGLENFCLPYIDDIAIFSNTWDEHIGHLILVFKRIREANLKVKLTKCQFGCKSVKYLGHVVGRGKRTPAEAKVKAITDFPTPKTKTQIRKFTGLCGYYAKYLKNYALIIEPLTRALQGKNRKESISWTEEMEAAFIATKQALTRSPVLYSPDYAKPFILQTDASDKGLGIILAQKFGDDEHPILFLSRKFKGPELHYGTTEKECAAIIFGIKKLRHYLDGQPFRIETDHNPLVWLKNNSGVNPRLLRWALTLQPFNFEISHRPGKQIPHVDCLSRAA